MADGEMKFDMAGALSEISDGLGFDTDDNNTSDTSDDLGKAPGTAPANSSAAPAPGAQPANTTPPATPPTFVPPEEHKHLFTEQGTLRTWRAEAAAEFANLPPLVQQEILKRENDIFKGIAGYKEAAAFGNSIKSVLDPYLPVLQQYGIAPEAQVADMMKAHYTLAFGSPQDKVALVQQIARDYGVPLDGLSAEPAYVDPQVKGLQQELAAIKSQLSQTQRAQLEVKRQEVERQVSAFAADPKNVYFDELANDIAHLLKTGAEKTIEAAYEKALWMNPAVRAKELSRQQAEKAEAERRVAEERAAAARKAMAVNVRTSAKSGSAAAATGSMDDTLQEALAAIRKRG